MRASTPYQRRLSSCPRIAPRVPVRSALIRGSGTPLPLLARSFQPLQLARAVRNSSGEATGGGDTGVCYVAAASVSADPPEATDLLPAAGPDDERRKVQLQIDAVAADIGAVQDNIRDVDAQCRQRLAELSGLAARGLTSGGEVDFLRGQVKALQEKEARLQNEKARLQDEKARLQEKEAQLLALRLAAGGGRPPQRAAAASQCPPPSPRPRSVAKRRAAADQGRASRCRSGASRLQPGPA
jgi:hypothetical protein